MNLLDAKTWTGKIFLEGWHRGSGGAFTEVQWVTLRGDLPSYPF